MNKVQTIILKFVAMMSFIAMVFSFCKIDADAMDWGPTNSNRYLIQNLGSNADIFDIVEYLDANWFYGIKLCETPYSAACSSCLSLQGTDQSIKNKIEEHMRPGKNGGMNCIGLVGYVYRQKGADLTKITQIRKGWYINATNWHNTASGQGGIANAARTYRYNTIQEMLSAKKAIKGDLIFFEPKNWYASGADCHIGFYWGNYPGHDQFLHNSTHPNRGAQITTVTPKCDSYVYVIKSAPSRITFDKNTTDTVTNMPANGKKYMNSPFIFPNQIPKREGYTFKGWDRDKNNTSGVFPGFEWWIEDENQTVYAIWEKNKNYNVKYVVDGDKQFTKTMEQEVDKNYTVLSLTDIASTAAKTGYTFSNWECNYYASESNISTKTYNPGDTYKNLSSPGTTATFTSKWKANKYTIKYNANGGSGTMSSQSATYDQNVTLNQNKFTKTGYTFLGWSEDSSATTPTYTDRQTVKNLSATNGATVNLYAVWHKNAVSTYLIRFNANGGSGYMSNMTCEVGTTYYLPENEFTKYGYTFEGWSLNSGTNNSVNYYDCSSVSNLSTVNGDTVTLYAVWKQVQYYYICFDSNGGEGYMSDQRCKYGEYVTLTKNAFTRSGYTFLGWANDYDATSPDYYDQQSIIQNSYLQGTRMLYAVWEKNSTSSKTYTIRFNSNGGSGYMSNMTCSMNTYYNLSANTFTRSGFSFAGWSLGSGNNNSVNWSDKAQVKNISSAGGTVTLYAVWAKEQYTYTIHFDSNGGSGYMDDMTCKTDEYVTLDQNAFYRDNYTFKGWATYSSGSVEYQAEARVYNLSTTNGDTVTLYAVWEKKTVPYSVIYRWNDQNSLSETKQYNMDTTYNFLTLQTSSLGNIEKPGYSFYRWYQLVSDTTSGWITSDWLYTYYQPGASFKNLTTTENGIVTLYGEWTANNYKIRFNANGGSGSMSDQSATYDQAVTLSANKFKRDGYKFVGWATSSYGYKKYDDEQTVRNLTTANGSIVTLYAVWEQTSQYTIRFDANGGKGSMSDMTCYYGVDVTLPKHTFTKDKTDFAGWSLDKNATNPTYGEQATVRDLTSTNNGIVTLYAVWNDIPGVDVDDIYIFKDEKDKVTTEFVEAESNLRIKKNNSETNVLEYHNTNIDDIKADLDADKDETTVKFDVIYNTSYETTATCKLYVIDIVHKDSALARVRYIDDAQYISESSVWSNSTMNTILRNALGVKENMDDIPSTEVEKADTTS